MSDLNPSPRPPSVTPAPEPKSKPLSSRPPPVGPAGRFDAVLGSVDRVARLQTIAAVILGLALIAIPLYLWRRPRAEAPPVTSALAATTASDAGALQDASAPPPIPGAPTVTLSEAKVMECHDTGARRTRPEDCDHLAAVEKGLASAITAAPTCLPTSAEGGTLVYVVDASFGRKHRPIEVFVPRDGRSLKSAHGTAAAAAASGCLASVKKGMESVALDGVPHAHARYKIAITATYGGFPSSP